MARFRHILQNPILGCALHTSNIIDCIESLTESLMKKALNRLKSHYKTIYGLQPSMKDANFLAHLEKLPHWTFLFQFRIGKIFWSQTKSTKIKFKGNSCLQIGRTHPVLKIVSFASIFTSARKLIGTYQPMF